MTLLEVRASTHFGRGLKRLCDRSLATREQADGAIEDEHHQDYLHRMLTDSRAVATIRNESWQAKLVRPVAHWITDCVFTNRPELVANRNPEEVEEAVIRYLNRRIDMDAHAA